MIRVHLNSGSVVEGTVHAIDPVTGAVVLKSSEGSGYSMLIRDHIARIEGDVPTTLTNDIPNFDAM